VTTIDCVIPHEYSASRRYQSDPAFRIIVDSIEYMLRDGTFTPSELREAVILAATHFELHNTRIFEITDAGIVDRLNEIHHQIDTLRGEARAYSRRSSGE
jgi:hypothetical protein